MDKNNTTLEFPRMIEKKPNWFIRWGVTVLFVIVIILTIICYWKFVA